MGTARPNPLTHHNYQTNLSDMEAETITYTARDLNRSPAKVLKTARTYGKARIRTRSGETFLIQPEKTNRGEKEGEVFPDFEKRWEELWAMGLGEASKEDEERFNQIIAGEI